MMKQIFMGRCSVLIGGIRYLDEVKISPWPCVAGIGAADLEKGKESVCPAPIDLKVIGMGRWRRFICYTALFHANKSKTKQL
jgi:hypothetical protein